MFRQLVAAKWKFSLGHYFQVSYSLVFTFNWSCSAFLSGTERYKSHRMLALWYRLSSLFLSLFMFCAFWQCVK